MSKNRPRVTILGGGIRGTAIAALLAQSQQFTVVLLERERIACGTTSTNQGRLHSGARIWQADYDEVARRQRIGSQLISQLPGVVEKQERSIYLVPTHEHMTFFEELWQRRLIPYTRIDTALLNIPWVQARDFAAAYEIVEYAFHPARLAGRFAAFASSFGAVIRTRACASAVESRAGQTFRVYLTDGTTLDTDILINALGNWVDHLRLDFPFPRLPLKWHQWRILCLFRPDLSRPVSRIRALTVLEQDRSPTAIAHYPWLTFGCRLTPEQIVPPSTGSSGTWRPFEKKQEMDAILFETHASYFLPLQSLNVETQTEDLFSFSGIYPAFDRYREDPFRLLESKTVPNYYVVYGESATTALLDALDTVAIVLARLPAAPPLTTSALKHLLNSGSAVSAPPIYADTAEMIWEEHTAQRRFAPG